MQIKIGDDIFNYLDGSVQLSLGSHATLITIFDLNQYPKYENHFIKVYESNQKFKIVSSKFDSTGCFIKAMDIDYPNKKMTITFHCDVLNHADTSQRRDDAINEILETFNKKDDIK
jgi:3-deoxy-D-arabino-heptulosonate 7-phosphate (DAHP) synthase class II